jgi:hypothetical protein
MDSDDQPITRKDLTEAFETFGRNDLTKAFEAFGRTFGASLMSEFRHELDAKLIATESRITEKLMLHTEETIGTYNSELLENIASIVQPMQTQVDGHDHRLARLEHKTA